MTESGEPLIYNWEYDHGVDEKRRVQIPSKWRPTKPEFEFTLIVWPKAKEGACLRVLPPKQMARLMADIDAMSNDDPKKVTLRRLIGSRSEQVTLDKAGRICLPESMAAEAGITDKVKLVGLLDRFEIWSPERYNRVKEADRVMEAEAFRMME